MPDIIDSPNLEQYESGTLLPKEPLSPQKKIHRLIFALSVLAIVLFASTRLFANSGSVSGIVINGATSQPVADVEVFILGTDISATTDANGKFTFRWVPTGEQVVVLGYSGTSWDYPAFIVPVKTVMLGSLPVCTQLVSEEFPRAIRDTSCR